MKVGSKTRGIFRPLPNIYDEAYAKIVANRLKLLTIFAKCSIMDVW